MAASAVGGSDGLRDDDGRDTRDWAAAAPGEVLACRKYGCFVANHWERDGQKWHFAKS